MHKEILIKLFIFVTGATVGSAITWKLVKSKYEQIAQEEINSVKEVFFRKTYEEVAMDFNEYEKNLKKNGYTNYSKTEKEEEEDDLKDAPYVIEPEEFGENDYETESLTYYADGILTDDFDNVIEDVDGMVGVDSLTHFGEYEDDSVFVRNDVTRTDYEIQLDTRKFGDL